MSKPLDEPEDKYFRAALLAAEYLLPDVPGYPAGGEMAERLPAEYLTELSKRWDHALKRARWCYWRQELAQVAVVLGTVWLLTGWFLYDRTLWWCAGAICAGVLMWDESWSRRQRLDGVAWWARRLRYLSSAAKV